MDKILEYALANHRELWERVGELCEKAVGDPNYYYDDGDDVKVVAIEEMGYSNNEINFNCFCCDYTGHNRNRVSNYNFSCCAKCPVDWGVNWTPDMTDCPCCMGDYQDYLDSVYEGCYGEAADYAYLIANLPINPIYLREDSLTEYLGESDEMERIKKIENRRAYPLESEVEENDRT